VRETVVVLFEYRKSFRWFLVLGTEYAKERLPPMVLLDCGAKVVVRLTLCPGASVNGKLSPLMLNPVPDTVA